MISIREAIKIGATILLLGGWIALNLAYVQFLASKEDSIRAKASGLLKRQSAEKSMEPLPRIPVREPVAYIHGKNVDPFGLAYKK